MVELPVVISGSRIALPLGNTPSTHIIKPEPERFIGLVATEVLCMMLAKEVGLNVPQVAVRLIGSKPCIVVRRYDRAVASDGIISRVHQEDFCQALGIPPERKYQQEGGPLLRDCIAMLRAWSTAPVLDIRGFLDGLIFSFLIGNADAHGKNYSLLYAGSERRLAPFYDLVCTLAWPELSKTMAMKIGQGDSIEAIAPDHWKKMTQETHLGWPMVRERMGELCRKTIDALQNPEMSSMANGDDISGRVRRIIEERAVSLLQGLNSRGQTSN